MALILSAIFAATSLWPSTAVWAAPTGGSCGGPDTGDCCVPGATPFCDDRVCCEAVCALDSFCCTVSWDGACAELAVVVCGNVCVPCVPTAPMAPNDCAEDAIALPLVDPSVGPPTAFDSTGANTDGPMNSCASSADIWYLVQAPGNPGGIASELTIRVTADMFMAAVAVYELGPSPTIPVGDLDGLLIDCVTRPIEPGVWSVTLGAVSAGDYLLVQVGDLGGAGGFGTIAASSAPTVFNTGLPLPALYDPLGMGNHELLVVGFTAGRFGSDQPNVWTAQPFTLAEPPDGGPHWRVDAVHVAGCVPGTPGCVPACAPRTDDCGPDGTDPGMRIENATLNMIIWQRTAFEAPENGDQILVVSVPFPTGVDLLDGAGQDFGIALEAYLPAGEYWLTVYPDGPAQQMNPAALVWLTNAGGDVIPNLQPVRGKNEPVVYRTESFPVPGFDSFALDPLNLMQAPPRDPDRLYSQSFRVIAVEEGDVDPCERIVAKLLQARQLGVRAEAKWDGLPVGAPLEIIQQILAQIQGQLASAQLLLIAVEAQIPEGGIECGQLGALPLGGDGDLAAQLILKINAASDLLDLAIGTLRDLLNAEEIDEKDIAAADAVLSPTFPLLIGTIEGAIQLLLPCPWDLDGDGFVGASDLGLLLLRWGLPGFGDFDDSGGVDGPDLGSLLLAWGECPADGN